MGTRPRRWRAAGAALAGALALAACTSSPEPESAAWAASAEDYFAAFREAQGEGFTNLAAFYAPDVAVDHRGLFGYEGIGRAGAVQSRRDSWQPVPVFDGVSGDNGDTMDFTVDEPLYLSADGAVDPARLDLGGLVVPSAFVYTLDRGGLRSEEFAGSAEASKSLGGYDVAAEEALAEAYLQAWAGGDVAAVAPLYAPGAIVRDTAAGLRLDGVVAIGEAAAAAPDQGGLPGAVLRTIREDGGPALYLNGPNSGSEPRDRMVLLLTVDEGQGCPGEVAVVLTVGGGAITGEERYHRVDALRRCTDPDARPSGWWDEVSVPNPRAVTRTGTVKAQAQEVAIWNGSDGLEKLVGWGLQRYADAALVPPIATSVAFVPNGDDPWGRHGFAHGSKAGDVALPFTADDACADADCADWPAWAKATTLHELAHLWLVRSLSDAAKAEFLERRGLTWSDPALPWAQQGSEVAAETVAWGLMDEPSRVDLRLGAPSCQQLADDFSLLTNAVSDGRACADSTGPG